MRRLLLLVVVASIAVGLTACGDDKDAATDTSATTVPAVPVADIIGPKVGDREAAKPKVEVPDPLPEGLYTEDLVVGDGPEVPAGATVTVEYVGVLTDGTEFDSSWSRPSPATFPLDQVIPGWTQGIPGMKVGGRRLLVIPGDLAYGAQGQPPTIGPNETLVFVVDAVDFEVPPATTTVPGAPATIPAG